MLNDDETSITLEHIFPKNKKSGTWPTFSEEDGLRFGRRLGNLCLLQRDTNSNLDNDSFAGKVEVLAKSPIHFTNHISTYTQWGPDEIESRQLYMAELAVKAWPI